MDLIQIVFSPTGGTQRVADILTENLGKPARKIDLTDAGLKTTHLEREDFAVIAVPSYGGRVPALAAQRLAQVHGNQARCAVVCVYGNRAYEDTLIELKDLAEQYGFQVIAAVSAVAEHSIMHQYAAGRPDRQDQDELRSFAEKIQKKLDCGDAGSASALEVPGDHPYKKAGGVGLVPKADGNCNGCGLCAENCPAQAISKENLKTADSHKCISCMRCVARCPQSARKVSGALVSMAALAIKKACSVRKSNELYI